MQQRTIVYKLHTKNHSAERWRGRRATTFPGIQSLAGSYPNTATWSNIPCDNFLYSLITGLVCVKTYFRPQGHVLGHDQLDEDGTAPLRFSGQRGRVAIARRQDWRMSFEDGSAGRAIGHGWLGQGKWKDGALRQCGGNASSRLC
jgi:hypothetical protein